MGVGFHRRQTLGLDVLESLLKDREITEFSGQFSVGISSVKTMEPASTLENDSFSMKFSVLKVIPTGQP